MWTGEEGALEEHCLAVEKAEKFPSVPSVLCYALFTFTNELAMRLKEIHAIIGIVMDVQVHFT